MLLVDEQMIFSLSKLGFVLACVPCIGRPSWERMRIQWSDTLRITRGCKATETLPVTPEAMTLGLAENT